jgi:hypothetical protein
MSFFLRGALLLRGKLPRGREQMNYRPVAARTCCDRIAGENMDLMTAPNQSPRQSALRRLISRTVPVDN